MGIIIFTPTADFYGEASFDYTVSDDGTTNGAADYKTDVGHVFHLWLTQWTMPQSANTDSNDITEDAVPNVVSGNVLANDTDVDNTPAELSC